MALIFGHRYLLEQNGIYGEVKSLFPEGHIVVGTTSGEIFKHEIHENSAAFSAIEFENSSFLVRIKNIEENQNNSLNLGQYLVN
ncbi:MAG: hypothetical protein ACJAUQ_000051 [Maribacter sp.]